EEAPQVVAVLQPGEAARCGAAAEAVEGAQRHVLLIRGAARVRAQVGAGALDQEAEVALPEGPGGGAVAGLEQVQPVGNGVVRRHGGNSPGPRWPDRAIVKAPHASIKDFFSWQERRAVWQFS